MRQSPGAHGVRLPNWCEPDLAGHWTATYTLRSRGYLPVSVHCDREPAQGARMVAAILPQAAVDACARMPDGRSVRAAGGEISVRPVVVHVTPGAPLPDWRDLEFRLTVRARWHRRVERTLRLGDALPKIVLEKRRP